MRLSTALFLALCAAAPAPARAAGDAARGRYLAILGVEPARQGTGIGAALMRHRLERCDRDGLLAYLESSNPRNVPFYRRHGFEVLDEIQTGTSPTIFPMLRHPR